MNIENEHPDLIIDLKKMLTELEHYSSKYSKMKDDNKLSEGISTGKKQAYSYSYKKLKNLLIWHGLIS